MYLIGIDIGGTKCAVSLGKRAADGGVRLLHRCESRPTAGRAPMELLAELCADARECMARAPQRPSAAGISCGGPLDSRRAFATTRTPARWPSGSSARDAAAAA